MPHQLLLNLLRSRDVVSHAWRNLIVELIKIGKLRGKVLVVAIGAPSVSQTLTVNSRHYHQIVRLCRKITVMMLFWYCWVQRRFHVVFKIRRWGRIILLFEWDAFLSISSWSLKPALLQSASLICNRYIILILPFRSLKLRLSDRWVIFFLCIEKWIIYLFCSNSISLIEICCLWPWS